VSRSGATRTTKEGLIFDYGEVASVEALRNLDEFQLQFYLCVQIFKRKIIAEEALEVYLKVKNSHS